MTVNTAARSAAVAARRPRSLTETRFRPMDLILKCLCILAGAVTIAMVAGLIGYILATGLPNVTWEFLTTEESALNRTYGILPNIINTLYTIVITLVVAAPLGVGGAIYLNEYAKKGRLTKIIEFTTEALAGIPSIIYGLFGMMVFNNTFGFGYSIISGCLTLSIMVLPTIIRTTQEALRTGRFQMAHHPHHPDPLLQGRHHHLPDPQHRAHRRRIRRADLHRRHRRQPAH